MPKADSLDKSKWKILALYAAMLAAAAGVYWLNQAGGIDKPRAAIASETPLKQLEFGEFRGFTMQLHNPDPNHPYEQYIDEIANTSANTLMLVVKGYQENCSSTSIFIDVRKTPGDQHLSKLIDYAHKKHLRVVLMPIVLLENPKESEWRGKIAPANWDDWWEDYTAYILHYAKIAEEHKAEVFMVGSELVSTEKYTDRWRKVIEQVRWVYKGLLGYSANWDHYDVVQFWDSLDIVGMTTYYDLTGGKEPTLETLIEAWKPIKQDILKWQGKVNRPIMFTEVGWPNQTTCAQYPWDYYRSPDKPDTQAQSNCFEAFFRTWIDEKSVAGFLVWEWRNYPEQPTGPEDTSYVPNGKPSLDVIRKYLQAPSAWRDDHKLVPVKTPTSTSAPAKERQEETAELELENVSEE